LGFIAVLGPAKAGCYVRGPDTIRSG